MTRNVIFGVVQGVILYFLVYRVRRIKEDEINFSGDVRLTNPKHTEIRTGVSDATRSTNDKTEDLRSRMKYRSL